MRKIEKGEIGKFLFWVLILAVVVLVARACSPEGETVGYGAPEEYMSEGERVYEAFRFLAMLIFVGVAGLLFNISKFFGGD